MRRDQEGLRRHGGQVQAPPAGNGKAAKGAAGIQQQLQTNAGKLTPAAEADLNAQGQRKQRELQRMNDDLQADVTAERNEFSAPAAAR
jgi:hypothetical protein